MSIIWAYPGLRTCFSTPGEHGEVVKALMLKFMA